jgi:hypothetical protein
VRELDDHRLVEPELVVHRRELRRVDPRGIVAPEDSGALCDGAVDRVALTRYMLCKVMWARTLAGCLLLSLAALLVVEVAVDATVSSPSIRAQWRAHTHQQSAARLPHRTLVVLSEWPASPFVGGIGTVPSGRGADIPPRVPAAVFVPPRA